MPRFSAALKRFGFIQNIRISCLNRSEPPRYTDSPAPQHGLSRSEPLRYTDSPAPQLGTEQRRSFKCADAMIQN
ncbi:hypothetical protein NDU88_003066 [Pleurodeles waltl]|uniref:Uncharacterized protein n=1 Tax=Pleurodeles waltl TaxID=8319 RepID=A0AAV7V095_PLEWA|nr:hypothetical protein NDU88_003066 [Pleurodeles waltl]